MLRLETQTRRESSSRRKNEFTEISVEELALQLALIITAHRYRETPCTSESSGDVNSEQCRKTKRLLRDTVKIPALISLL